MEPITDDLLQKKLEEIQAKSIGRTSQTYNTFCGKYCDIDSFNNRGTCVDKDKADDCPTLQDFYHYRFRRAGIEKRYWDCNFKSIQKRGINTQVQKQYDEIMEYYNNLPDNLEKGLGLILKGPVGTMKTTFGIAILQDWIKYGGNAFFVSMASLLDNIFTLKAKNNEEATEYERKIRNTKLLLLDDLGAEHTEGWVLTKVDAIISERYNKCLSTIVTTNLSTDELKKTYAERIVDRLRSTSTVITFTGNSLRVKKGA